MNVDQEYQDEFYENEKLNAINKAKVYFNIPDGYGLLEQPEPPCAINYNTDGSIKARVRLSYQNIETEAIMRKVINLNFHDDGVKSFWSYAGSENG